MEEDKPKTVNMVEKFTKENETKQYQVKEDDSSKYTTDEEEELYKLQDLINEKDNK